MPDAYDIFISYSWHVKKETVKRIKDRLTEHKFETWFDESNMGMYSVIVYCISCNMVAVRLLYIRKAILFSV